MLLIRGNIQKYAVVIIKAIAVKLIQERCGKPSFIEYTMQLIIRIQPSTSTIQTHAHTHRSKIENNKSYYKHQVWHHMIQKLVITLKLSILGFLL